MPKPHSNHATGVPAEKKSAELNPKERKNAQRVDHFYILDGVCQKYEGKHTQTVCIPEGVIRLNARLFSDHAEIKEILLPKTLKKIGKCAFEGCTSLEVIHLNEGLLEIGESAFSDCYALKQIQLPESVTRIGQRAFCQCENLRDVVLPTMLKHIPMGLFQGCVLLKKIRWPKHPKLKVDPLIFGGCFSLDLSWEYFQLKDGICERVLGDIFEICPNGELLTDIVVLRQNYFRCLTLISVSAELDPLRLQCRHQIFQIFMGITHILTQSAPCAMFWAARACIQYVWQHAMQWTEIPNDLKLNMIRQILTEIGGCGARIHLKDMMLYEEYVKRLGTLDAAFDLYLDHMKQLHVEDANWKQSHLRYHPQHYLYVAWLEPRQEQSYWAFATCIDGLFQTIEGARHMHYLIPEPEGGYEAWLAAWSRALVEHQLGILELRFELQESAFMPRLFFAIEQSCVFHQMYDFLEPLGIQEILYFWFNGEDISISSKPNLRLVD